MDLQKELTEGRLCEEGFLKETYDNGAKDLVRRLTPKGIQVVKQLLKDPANVKDFKNMLSTELIKHSPDERERILMNVVNMLR